MESHPLRVVAMGPNDTLVSVHRELGHRGSAILVWPLGSDAEGGTR